MVVRALAVAAGLAATVALTGCGGGSSSGPHPTPLPVSSSPVAVGSHVSSSVDPNSDAAILAAVQAYADAASHVAASASTADLDSIIDQSCPCRATLGLLASELQSHGWHENVRFTVDNPRIVARTATHADVEFALSNGTFQVLGATGAVMRDVPGGSTPTTISLQRRGAAWVVFYVDSPH